MLTTRMCQCMTADLLIRAKPTTQQKHTAKNWNITELSAGKERGGKGEGGDGGMKGGKVILCKDCRFERDDSLEIQHL